VAAPRTQARIDWRHRAWLVAGVTFVALVSASAFRSSTGVLLEPVSSEHDWSRATVSFAVTINLALYGLVAPFAAALMERWGIRRVVAAALCLLAIGMALTTIVTQPWQLMLAWGFLMGFGAGSMALVFGAVVAQRWFVERRGLVMGIFSAASAAGQLIFLPTLARLTTDHGWRSASLLLSAVALALVPLVLGALRDRPSDVGLLPYGAPAGWTEPPTTSGDRGAAAIALLRLREASRTRAFWLLAFAFFVCGWSTNGLVGLHFIPAAHDHGMPATTAAGLLALIGVFDLVGTIGSGWLTDRYDARKLLAIYYAGRGLSLLVVHLLWAPTVEPPMFFFVVLYGLDWVATVPPTVQLCRECFGAERAGVVFGWVFASHMIGAGIAAVSAGLIREISGSYDLAWWSAGALCLVAAVASLVTPYGDQLQNRSQDPDPELAPA